MKLSPPAIAPGGLLASATRQAVAASLLSAALLVGGPAIAEDEQTSADFKMLGGGASTLQSGRRITILTTIEPEVVSKMIHETGTPYSSESWIRTAVALNVSTSPSIVKEVATSSTTSSTVSSTVVIVTWVTVCAPPSTRIGSEPGGLLTSSSAAEIADEGARRRVTHRAGVAVHQLPAEGRREGEGVGLLVRQRRRLLEHVVAVVAAERRHDQRLVPLRVALEVDVPRGVVAPQVPR